MKIKKDVAKQSDVLKAVSDPARLSVLKMVLKKETYVSEIIKAIKIEPTLLSHHLSILRKQGLIASARQGKTVLCKIDPKAKIKGKASGVSMDGVKVTFE